MPFGTESILHNLAILVGSFEYSEEQIYYILYAGRFRAGHQIFLRPCSSLERQRLRRRGRLTSRGREGPHAGAPPHLADVADP